MAEKAEELEQKREFERLLAEYERLKKESPPCGHWAFRDTELKRGVSSLRRVPAPLVRARGPLEFLACKAFFQVRESKSYEEYCNRLNRHQEDWHGGLACPDAPSRPRGT